MLEKLLTTPTAQLSRASRFVVFQIKLWTHCARLLKKNRAGQQAAALSYHTIFGIVPLAIIILMVFQLFPSYSNLGDKAKSFVYEELHLTNIEYTVDANPENSGEKVMLTGYIDEIVNNFIVKLDEGKIALFSAVILVFTALALLFTIEKSFNDIWFVARGRNFLHRVINYWALLTLGPLLIALGIYASTNLGIAEHFHSMVSVKIAKALFSYTIAISAFFLLYFVLPNTKVSAKAAIWGALVSALAWSIAKWGFDLYVTRLIPNSPYSVVYGVVGLIPLTVFWIFLSWVIILFGLQLTFTTQHLDSLDSADMIRKEKTSGKFIANDLTVINILRKVAEVFENNGGAVKAEVICSSLDMPADFGAKILDYLVSCKLIARVSEPNEGFIIAADPANIRLSEISAAVASAGLGKLQNIPQKFADIRDMQHNTLSQYTLKDILDTNA